MYKHNIFVGFQHCNQLLSRQILLIRCT